MVKIVKINLPEAKIDLPWVTGNKNPRTLSQILEVVDL